MANVTNGFDFTLYTSIGAILIRSGELTQRQLDRALEIQRKQGGEPQIGDMLISMGICTREAVIAAVEHQRAVRPSERCHDTAPALQQLSIQVERAEESQRRHSSASMKTVQISPKENKWKI